MTATVRQELAALLELADRMRDGATAGDWDVVAQLRDDFQRCAERLFAGPLRREDAAVLGDVIRRVSTVNGEVVALCRDARDVQGRELEVLRQGRRAVSRYAANTG